ncbi:MAG TPA: hypothetical protein VJQ46_15205 [Gemmatimonadales bacterium]|nr:hypothetical protein [Gemmatimonadales bacterium]
MASRLVALSGDGRSARSGVGLLALAAVGLAAASGSLAGCSGTSRDEAPLRVAAAPAGADTRLTLHAAPNLKINARVVPALELTDRSVVRFGAGRLTADSAYFAEPPSALLTGRHDAVHGTLRASVCEVGAQVCRSLVVEI